MNNRLFVGGIAWATTKEGLMEHFGGAGAVEDAAIVTDRETGRSRGFGFVTMSSEEEAQKAIEMFDGQELDGRPIKVNIARPREER